MEALAKAHGMSPGFPLTLTPKSNEPEPEPEPDDGLEQGAYGEGVFYVPDISAGKVLRDQLALLENHS